MLLDIPVFAFIIFGKHGMGNIFKATLGTLYWAFPLFVLRRCPFHVLVKWLFETGRTTGLMNFMKKTYGKRFILMVIYVFASFFIFSFLVLKSFLKF